MMCGSKCSSSESPMPPPGLEPGRPASPRGALRRIVETVGAPGSRGGPPAAGMARSPSCPRGHGPRSSALPARAGRARVRGRRSAVWKTSSRGTSRVTKVEVNSSNRTVSRSVDDVGGRRGEYRSASRTSQVGVNRGPCSSGANTDPRAALNAGDLRGHRGQDRRPCWGDPAMQCTDGMVCCGRIPSPGPSIYRKRGVTTGLSGRPRSRTRPPGGASRRRRPRSPGPA